MGDQIGHGLRDRARKRGIGGVRPLTTWLTSLPVASGAGLTPGGPDPPAPWPATAVAPAQFHPENRRPHFSVERRSSQRLTGIGSLRACRQQQPEENHAGTGGIAAPRAMISP